MRHPGINNHLSATRRCRSAGFSLLELLTVIGIVGIVAAIGFTGFQSWTRFSQVTDTSQSLKTAVNYARAEAIKHGGRVKVCGSTDQLTCAASFATGWLVYFDIDNDANLTAADELLMVKEQPHSQVAIMVSDGAGGAVPQIGFNHRGYPDTVFSVTATRGPVNEQFTLQRTGRVETL